MNDLHKINLKFEFLFSSSYLILFDSSKQILNYIIFYKFYLDFFLNLTLNKLF